MEVCFTSKTYLEESHLEEHRAKIEREITKINEAYRYNIVDLYEVPTSEKKVGFFLNSKR